MSFEPDNVEHELTVKELLERILEKLSILCLHHEEITGEKITNEDVDE